MKDMLLSREAFRRVLGEMIDEAIVVGRNEAEPELYESTITAKMVEDIMEYLIPYTDKDVVGESLRNDLESRTREDRRLAICGMFGNSEEWDWMDAKRGASEIYSMARWLYESHTPMRRMPSLFLADYGRSAMYGEYTARAIAGDPAARWFMSFGDSSGPGRMCAFSRRLVERKIAEYSARDSVKAPSFNKQLFEDAVDKYIGYGIGYADQLRGEYNDLPDDMARANAMTALFELYAFNPAAEGVTREDYESAVEAILHWFKAIDLMGIHCPEAVMLLIE